jgi:hypothetical protein
MSDMSAALDAAQKEASSFYSKRETAQIIHAFLRALPPAYQSGPAWIVGNAVQRAIAEMEGAAP